MVSSKFVATGYVNNVKEVGEKLVVFSLAIGVKQEDGSYKNGFVNCKANREKVKVEDKARVVVTGFPTFDFWKKDSEEKERQNFYVFVQEITPAE
jgi:hypothetical protein